MVLFLHPVFLSIHLLSNEKAILHDFEPVQRQVEKNDIYSKYMINPSYLTAYLNKFSKSYNSLGVNNLASNDFMTFLPDTYRKTICIKY